MIVYNYDADLEVSDTCVRSCLLSMMVPVNELGPGNRSCRHICIVVGCHFGLRESLLMAEMRRTRFPQRPRKYRNNYNAESIYVFIILSFPRRRPHRMHSMDVSCCYRGSSVVCLCVGHDRQPCKNRERKCADTIGTVLADHFQC